MNTKSLSSISLGLFIAFLVMPSYAQQHWAQQDWPETEFDLTAVDLAEIRGGGPPKDGIPSIDRPTFENHISASKWMEALEPVIAVEIDGVAKAYPLKILIFHEIVNDELNGIPVSVTFCPLCNASIVFDRRLNNQILDFGTTGLLRKSDLVMYDRQSESWWQQFSGKAIVGSMLGSELERIPSSIVSYTSFKDAFPQGKTLSKETGFPRTYGRNPYSGYDSINQSPFLFDGELDDRLPPMERVLTITIKQDKTKSNKIYPLSELAKEQVINDEYSSIPLVVFASGKTLSVLDTSRISKAKKVVEATVWQRQIDGREKPLSFKLQNGEIVDLQTGSTWNVLGKAIKGPLMDTQLGSLDSGVHFAFAWLAFNPQSDIYRSPN